LANTRKVKTQKPESPSFQKTNLFMFKEKNRYLPLIFTLLLTALPSFLIGYFLLDYKEMKMWKDITDIKDYIEKQIKPFSYVALSILFVGIAGNIIRGRLGWVMTINIFYFFMVYIIFVLSSNIDYTFFLALFIPIILIVFMNHKIILNYYKLGNKNRITFNLAVLIVAMIQVLSLKNYFL
jgi:hypothetical protein